MEFAYVSVPAAPVRRKPAHSKEMVNQLLFGEAVRVLAVKGDLWVRVQSLHDLYEGWTTRGMLSTINEEAALLKPGFTTKAIFGKIMLNNSPQFITAGASLPGFSDGHGKLGELEYEFKGEVIQRDKQELSGSLVTGLSYEWLNAPYLWGGRTVLGTDCSGFVQVIYKMMGLDLSRDASQQVMEGKPVQKFRERRAGDLAFFGSKGAITHVGIILDEEKIIHASGKVKIDILDKKGIIDPLTGKRAQKLKNIQRYW